MYRLTRRIALIAYVLGGWLLPLLHHHGHSLHEHRNGFPVQTIADASVCSGHFGCFGHVHVPPNTPKNSNARLKTQTTVRSQVNGSLAAGEDLVSCSGLCAACVARTLAATRVSPAGTSLLEIPPEVFDCPLVRLTLQREPSSLSARGPPAVL